MIFFHNNTLASFATDVLEDEKLTSETPLMLTARAGYPSDIPIYFMLANTGSEAVTIRIDTTLPSFQISTNKIDWQQDFITVAVGPNKTSDAIFVRLLSPDGTEEGVTTQYVIATNENDPYEVVTFPVNGFISEINEFDTSNCQATRFFGSDTNAIGNYFDEEGEVVRIIEYTPLEKPDRNEPVTSLQQLRNRNVAQLCNPYNAQVGYSSTYFTCKAFVGNKETITNRFFETSNIDVNFAEENAIVLQANFPGFCPSPQRALVEFGDITPFVTAFQSNVFTIFRDNAEYSLRNIRRVNLPRGQIGFWLADLQRIELPNADNPRGFLPWNLLYDDTWREISYVPSWSTEHVSEDPYCPYSEDAYL